MSNSLPSELLLLGLSWIEDKSFWLAAPLTIMYSLSCLANSAIAAVILLERTLHKPMYLYISMLALLDLLLSGTVIPKVLAILWFDLNSINVKACLAQMYIFYVITGVDLSLFTIMSYDRYVAICHPLRYSSIMTNSFTFKSMLVLFIRGMILVSPLPYLTIRLQYCNSNNIINAFCEHVSIIRLACGDMTPSNIYMYIAVVIGSVADCILIGISYFIIFRVVLRLRSSESRKKAFSTCSSHLIVIVFYAFSSTFSFFLYLFESKAPLSVHTMSTILNSLIPPMLNPLVYGGRMTEIRQGLVKLSMQIHHWIT